MSAGRTGQHGCSACHGTCSAPEACRLADASPPPWWRGWLPEDWAIAVVAVLAVAALFWQGAP